MRLLKFDVEIDIELFLFLVRVLEKRKLCYNAYESAFLVGKERG